MRYESSDDPAFLYIGTRFETYCGPHFHAAIKCLRAGFEANARSWMERDIGEIGTPRDYPAPGSLVDGGDCIRYVTVGDALTGVGGDGI